MTVQGDRRGEGVEWRRLGLIVLLATLVRLPLILLSPGYDVLAYRIWAEVVHAVGIGGAYGATYPTGPESAPYHYQPFYLYVLRATGFVYAALWPGGDWRDQALASLLKCAPTVAELALGVLIWRFLRVRVAPQVAPRVALGAAAAYLFTPGLIWNTAYWGGIDAFQALFLTLGLCATVGGATVRAWPLATLAVCTKLTALPGALAVIPTALRSVPPRRLVAALVAALATLLVLTAPILAAGQLGAMRRGMFDNLSLYALTSFNAHNLWWLLTWGQGQRPDTTVAFTGLNYRQIGRLLALLAACPVLYRLWREPTNIPRVFATSAFLSFAFVMLTTGVHENWAYILFAPLLVAAALEPSYRPLYALLALTFLLNLALEDPPLHQFVADWSIIRQGIRATRLANAAVQCGVLGWWGWKLLR